MVERAEPVAVDGRLEAIWIKRAPGGPMDAVPRATLAPGRGIVGNADQGGWRQVTILDVGAWEVATSELDRPVDPSARRANLLLRGIDLRESRRRVLAVGGCRIGIRGETRPCGLMDEAAPGLRDALGPEWRGGAFGIVIIGGEIALGDRVRWLDGLDDAELARNAAG